MAEQTRMDAKVAGDGALSGGTYGNITVNGAGSINGDIDCLTFKINGASTNTGRVVAQTMVVNGSATINGELQAGLLKVNGDTSVRDGAGVGQLIVNGNCQVGGSVASHQVDLKGYLKVGGDLETDAFSGDGAFQIGGLLNAGLIDLRLHGPASAREIGGERVSVRLGSGWGSLFTFFADKRLITDSVEADQVSLEYTTAKVVRGKDVTIGQGCSIGLVEYAETYTPLAGASVGEARRVENAAV